MTARAPPRPVGNAGRVKPRTLVRIAKATSAPPAMKNGVLDRSAVSSAASRMVRSSMRGTLSSGAARGAALVSGLRRLELPVVVAADLRMPVRPLRGRVERHERELRDRLRGVQLDRDPRQVRDLKRQRAAPPGVHEARGRVDDEAEPAEGALPLYARDDVVRQLHPLERSAEDELAGVDDERVAVLDRHLLGEV